MFNSIKTLLKRAWNFLKKVFVQIVNFFKNIIAFFQSKYHALRNKRPNIKAISLKIKNELDSGNYNKVSLNDFSIVNTFYDTDTNEIVIDNGNTEVVNFASLDQETKNRFGNQEMIVIE